MTSTKGMLQIWGGPRTLKDVLISGPQLPFQALSAFFDIEELVGLGVLAGSGRLRPALAGPRRLHTALSGLSEIHGSGRLWPALAGSGRPRLCPGWLRPALVGSGRPWLVPAGLECSAADRCSGSLLGDLWRLYLLGKRCI